MIRKLFGLVRGVVVLGILVYLLFFVQLGERTAFQHLMRIADTDEAQELKREATEASKRIGSKIKTQIEEELPERFPAQDPGATDADPSADKKPSGAADGNP